MPGNPNAVRIVMSGHEPPPSEFYKYPTYLYFDGRLRVHYDKAELARVALFSVNTTRYVTWSNPFHLSQGKIQVLQGLVDQVYRRGKVVRFYGAPNSEYAYRLFMDLGVGYINVDYLGLSECVIRFHANCHMQGVRGEY